MQPTSPSTRSLPNSAARRPRRARRRGPIVAIGAWIAVGFCALLVSTAGAANPPDDFVDLTVADEIFAPTQMEFLPDGRLVVMTDAGIAELFIDDVRQNPPLFDIRNRVDDVADRGLFSMAVDNDFAANGHIYVMYTFDTNGNDDGIGATRLSRFTVTGNTAGNEVVLFQDFPPATVSLHYGGAVEMGPDDKLYVTVGDHLLGANGQNRDNLAGSVLRLNSNGSIPTDNPFYDELDGVNRAIYAYGIRSPWQMEEHPVTGQIFISDVGSDDWEELNVLEEGANYGWFEAEGPKDPNDPAQADFTDPLWAFPHFGVAPGTPIQGCAIVGGAFYSTPNPSFPAELREQYFTGDYCTGAVVTVDPVTGVATEFMDGFDELVDVAVSPTNGDLYYLDRSFRGDQSFPKGGVGKIRYTGPLDEIVITTPPTDVSIAAGSTASFFVGAAGPGDLSYQWRRDGQPIPGETSPFLELVGVQQGDDGARFRVDVTNGLDTVRTDAVTLDITDNTAPVPNITITNGDQGGYQAERPILFTGSAVDAEDGPVPPASLRWQVRLNHDEHDHDLIDGIIGPDGSVTVPANIETDTNVWVTVYLTATDSDGTAATTSARVDPRIVTLTLASNPGGLDLEFEGSSVATPFAFDSVTGVVREFGAAATQSIGGATAPFESWSDGLGRNTPRVTPGDDTTYLATYSTGPTPDVCNVTAEGGGQVRVEWTDLGGTEIVRNSDGWVATPAIGVTSLTTDGEPNDGWFIRRRGGGQVTDETCTTGPPIDAECTTTPEGGGVRINWTAVAGENRYQIRTSGPGGVWLATVVDQTTALIPDADPAADYLVRHDLGQGRVDRPCSGGDEPPPPPDAVCFVENVPGGVRITWQDKARTEILRNDGGWVATPAPGTLTYTEPGGALNDGWFIRRTGGGNDEICQIL